MSSTRLATGSKNSPTWLLKTSVEITQGIKGPSFHSAAAPRERRLSKPTADVKPPLPRQPCCRSPFPSSPGSRAMLTAMHRASSFVSTFACAASVLVARLPADPRPVPQANQVSSSSRAMRSRTRRTCWADHDPRLEGVGIFLAVSAAARARGDLSPPARSLVRIGAKLAARASARSDWALEPGLPLVRAWIISHQ
jgi:hypothetical protein